MSNWLKVFVASYQLGSSDGETFDRALRTLSQARGSRLAARRLERFLAESRSFGWGRRDIVSALSRLGDPQTVDLFRRLVETDPDSEIRRTSLEALSSLGAVSSLVALLNKGCHGAARSLGRTGSSEAIGPLLETLRDPTADESEREDAARGLGRLGADETLDDLLGALESGSRSLASAAANALGRLGSLRALEPLLDAWDRGTVHYPELTRALGRLGDPRATERLLGDSDYFIRRDAAWALGEIGDARAIEPLIASLGNDIAEDRQACAAALEKLGEPQWRERIQSDLGDLERLGASGDSRAFPALARAVSYKVEKITKAAGLAMLELNPERAFETLLPEVTKRTWGPRALSSILAAAGGDKAVEPLIRVLRDSRDAETARALGELNDRRTIEPLLEVLEQEVLLETDPSRPSPVDALIETLARYPEPEVIEALVKVFANREIAGSFRVKAGQALAQLKAPHTLPDLFDVLREDDNSWLRTNMIEAFSVFRNEDYEKLLIDFLGGDSDVIHVAAARALGSMGSTSALSALGDLLGHPLVKVRKEAKRAMEQIRASRLLERKPDGL